MRRIALIPARGGSKRLPRKNIIDFLGKPIIGWTIESAIQSGCFDRVVVSTEDDEIAKVAKDYGAEIDDRDAGLSTDDARVLDVCTEFLERESDCDVLCVLYATAPLRTADDIKKTVDLVSAGECDFSVAVTDYDMPPHQALKDTASGIAAPMWPELVNKRSDEIGKLVVDNGSTYAVSVPAFLKEKTFYGEKLKTHFMPRERSQDIDEEIDLEIAKIFATKQGLAA